MGLGYGAVEMMVMMMLDLVVVDYRLGFHWIGHL